MFFLSINGNEAVLTDRNDDTLILVYDSDTRSVQIKED